MAARYRSRLKLIQAAANIKSMSEASVAALEQRAAADLLDHLQTLGSQGWRLSSPQHCSVGHTDSKEDFSRTNFT